jgi:MoaA/NifB/PqqE/SkfB family radical SAM enzyme
MPGVNPFKPIYEKCNSPKGKLIDFPRMIDLEPTSTCNFRCLMCPTGNRSLTRPGSFMGSDTFNRIAVEASYYGAALRFIGWGEPLLHPNISDFINIASEYGLLTHLNTNGSKVDSNYLGHELVRSGLNSIKFSFQGVDRQSYLNMRRADFFDGMMASIKCIRGAKEYHKSDIWIAASTSVTNETPKQIADFIELMTPWVDELSIGTTTFDFMDLNTVRLRPGERDLLEELQAQDTTEKRHPDPCPEVFDKLSIHADGTVVVCCNDFNGRVTLGNVDYTPILDMWRHPDIEAYRKRLTAKEYSGPLCSVCYDYMGLTDSANAG